MKVIYIISILFLFISCKNGTNEEIDFKNVEQIVSTEDIYFENEKANRLNQEAIEYGKKGFPDKSCELLLEALKIEPNNPTLYNNLGLVYSLQNENKKSISSFQKSLLISDSTFLQAAVNLGLEYNKVGEYQNAINVLNFTIIKTQNKQLEIGARINKIFSLTQIKKCEEAKVEIKKIESNHDFIDVFTKQINDAKKGVKNCDKN